MLLPIVERADGLIDGVNRVFSTSRPYVRDSLVVFLNEIALSQARQDGWEEVGKQTFRMNEIPHLGDSLSVYYLPEY